MQDAIAGFQEAPLWVQVALALFAVMVVVSLVGPSLRRRKFRLKFEAIARALGAATPTGRGWPVVFRIDAASRPFELRHDLRTSGKGTSYRGPIGHVLITVTSLAGTKWTMHQVDIARLSGRLTRFLNRKRGTGDPDFDERFVVVEDGAPVREAWLDAATREAISRFFELAPATGVIWVHEGELQFIMPDPWPAGDGTDIRTLLERQAALASALDATAGKRW